MPPRLPGELTDRITWLVSDYRTLLSCALVCQEWLPASRTALLDCVRLNRKPGYDSFIKDVLGSEHMYPYLRTTRAMWIDQRLARGSLVLTEQPWSYRTIHEFSGHFPKLEHLRLSDIDWNSPKHWQPHPSVHLAIRGFTSLRKLELMWCQLPSWHTLRRLVMALSPSLTFLTLLNVSCPSPHGEAPAFVYCATASLHKFELIGVPSIFSNQGLEPFLRWLSYSCPSNSLRRLVFSEPKLSTEYGGILTRIVPGLVELCIIISSGKCQ